MKLTYFKIDELVIWVRTCSIVLIFVRWCKHVSIIHPQIIVD